MDKTQPHPLFKLATELGPLLVFFIANAKANLFVATGAFMVAIVVAMNRLPLALATMNTSSGPSSVASLNNGCGCVLSISFQFLQSRWRNRAR